MKRDPLSLEYAVDLAGRRFLFVGGFERWPRLLGAQGPQRHVVARGGRIVKQLERADYLVVGNQRGRGKADLLKRAEKRRAAGKPPEVLDESAFLHLARPKLDGCSIQFLGGVSKGFDIEGPAGLVAAIGARLASPEEERVDFCVVGPGRAKGKTAALKRLETLQSQGARLRIVDEELFLDLVTCLRGPRHDDFDFRALALQLRALTDPKKVERAVQMLKRESMQLFSEVTNGSVGGIVKSQTQDDAYYACWLKEDGSFSCFDRNLEPCMGQGGDLCKHLVVLLVGLSVKGSLDPRQAHAWATLAAGKWQAEDATPSSELILRYRGHEAGEQDWRPTQTVPEDFYTL